MIDLPWKVFSKTGSIEAYLLMKQMEETNRSAHQKNNVEEMKTTLTNNRQ
ncbi:YqzL family protein [Tenuibacillus multivorans]|uniref:YqzL-like protein n=1 Tax=Tenuibacillus multivorans TaxID=237069 RepID=A0A1G9ZCK3_9BACI|nr:YqzL family protein [Tenuibacillus multivorans]GEL78310.1 hypothetical protein TMU01_25450 [Tenuibacillus multivorans]SDN19118.1 YqzL-like protein [Tenuibacillus multivorans]